MAEHTFSEILQCKQCKIFKVCSTLCMKRLKSIGKWLSKFEKLILVNNENLGAKILHFLKIHVSSQLQTMFHCSSIIKINHKEGHK